MSNPKMNHILEGLTRISEGTEYDLTNKDDQKKACDEYSKCTQNCLSSSSSDRKHELDKLANQVGLKFVMMNYTAYMQPHALVKPKFELVEESKIQESSSGNKDYEAFKKACKENATYKKAAAIAKKYGYELDDLCYVEIHGTNKDVYIRFKYNTNEYAPEINYSSYDKSPEFRIQTSAHGALSLKDHDKYLKAVQDANAMVRELSKLDLTTLNQNQT
jgi:hypothetical protein